jgi:hypothetical protein
MEFSSAKDQVSASLITRPALGETVGAAVVEAVGDNVVGFTEGTTLGARDVGCNDGD